MTVLKFLSKYQSVRVSCTYTIMGTLIPDGETINYIPQFKPRTREVASACPVLDFTFEVVVRNVLICVIRIYSFIANQSVRFCSWLWCGCSTGVRIVGCGLVSALTLIVVGCGAVLALQK